MMKEEVEFAAVLASAGAVLNAAPSNDSKDTRKSPVKPMATINDDDERLLAQIGYKQVSSLLLLTVR
jgi:hypothetical protein